MEYFDNVAAGMQDVLTWIHTLEEAPDMQMVVNKGKEFNLHSIEEDKKKIWRALKKLTSGIAGQVIRSTKDEDGYLAWHRLANQFEPSLVAMRGEVLAELSVMSRSPAKTPADTKTMLAIFQAKRKRVEDITGEELGGIHMMSTLMGFIDETTKQHTIREMPTVATATNVDKYITDMLKFINTVTGGGGGGEASRGLLLCS